MTIRLVSNRPWSQDYGGQNLVRKNDLLLKSWIFENRVLQATSSYQALLFSHWGMAFLAVAINNQSALHQIILGFYECQRYCSNSFFLIRWVKFIWRGTHIETLKQKLPYNQYRKFSGGCTGITIFDVLQCYEMDIALRKFLSLGLLKKLKFYWKHDFLTLPSSWIISHIIYWQHGRLRIYYCCFSCTKRRQLLKCRPFSSS